MTKAEIVERAHNKAFSKILTLQRNIDNFNDDIKSGNTAIVPIDTLKDCVKSTERDLQTWQYIAKLIELYGDK